MEYYIFCDFWDEHRDELEHEDTFIERLYAYKEDGSKRPHLSDVKISDKFLFMGGNFIVRAKGQVTDVEFFPNGDPELEERTPMYRFTFDIKQLKTEICLDDSEWREFLASVQFNGAKYGTFIKEKNVKPLKAYFRNVIRRINREIYEKIVNSSDSK